jgi:outer membrane protein TolC
VYLILAELEENEGMITKTDYLKTLLEYKKMEFEANAAQDECKNAETALKNLMNLDRGHALVLSESECFEAALTDFAALENLTDKSMEYKQSAVQNSLNIKLSRAELNWAKKLRSIQKRIFIPSVSVRGSVAFSGRNYPLTSPTYSVSLVLSFEDNPWINASISRQHAFNKGKLNSLADTVSGKGMFNSIYFNQLKLSKIELSQKKVGYEKTKKQIEENVIDRIQKIEQVQKSFLLGLENVKIKEQKLLLSKLQLEQGKIKKSDYLEEMNECAKEKIQCLSLLKDRDYLIKELETIVSKKF